MLLNKYAPWGALPTADDVGPADTNSVRGRLTGIATSSPLGPKLDALTDAVDRSSASGAIHALATGLAPLADLPQAVQAASAAGVAGLTRLEASVDRLAAVFGQVVRVAPTPSATAFRILATLGQVRDALCDQGKPTARTTDAQLAKAREARSSAAARDALAGHDALVRDFDDQFAAFDPAFDFDLQRRTRLAALATFEWKVLSQVGDPEPPPSRPASDLAR